MNSLQSQNDPVSHSEGETSKISTTIISDDASSQVQRTSAFVDDSLFSNINFDGVHDLRALLERPVKLQGGNFTNLDTTRLYNADPFAALMTTWSTKLDRAQLIRADVEVILQVNAMRFQAGRYILAFLPSYGEATNTPNFSVYEKMHSATLSQLTQLPHVEIDLAYETSVTMLLPWQGVIAAWPNQSTITNGIGFGKLILFPYAALIPELTAASAGYTLYARFVNPVVSMPTVAQSGTEIEQKKAGIGPVSGFLNKVSKSTKILSQIPLVGPYLGQMSWVSSLLGSAASVFGWCKPPILSPPNFVQTRKLAYIEVSDGASTARPLGGFSTNSVQPYGAGANPKEDQMDLSYITKKYAHHATYAWTTAQAAGDQIFTIDLKPTTFQTTYGLATFNTPVAFPTSLFSKYRGSFMFKIKLVKNEFYSGRIGVLFHPYEVGATTTTLTTDLGLAYNRAIIDVRNTREFEVVCPYSSTYAFRYTNQTYGMFVLYVIDPLVCPDNLAGNIPILVEVSGCDDFEYADYTWSGTLPVQPYTTQAAPEVPCECFTLGPHPTPGVAADKVAIGERFTSLRQVAKLFCYRQNTWSYDSTKAQYVNPFVVTFAAQPTSLATAYTQPEISGDVANLILSLYGRHFGSMRVQFWPTIGTGASKFQYGIADSAFTATQITLTNFSFMRGWISTVDEVLDVIIPAFTQTAGRALSAVLGNVNAPTPIAVAGASVARKSLVVRLWDGTAPSQAHVTRQFSDDGSCTDFLSVPGTIAG